MEILLIILGGLLSMSGINLIFKKPVYHFEKTTTGHTIKFLDYNELNKIKRHKIIGFLLLLFGVIVIVIGIYLRIFLK